MSVLTQTFEAKMRHLTVENRQLRRNYWKHFHERRICISKSIKIFIIINYWTITTLHFLPNRNFLRIQPRLKLKFKKQDNYWIITKLNTKIPDYNQSFHEKWFVNYIDNLAFSWNLIWRTWRRNWKWRQRKPKKPMKWTAFTLQSSKD